MRLLSLVGLAEDDGQLILVSDDGAKFAIPVNDRLVAAVVRDVERRAAAPTDLGPLDGAPTPREIQERIRHGQSIESIAAGADVSRESVERFAHQVLTERNYVATQARDTTVNVGQKQFALGEAVVERLRGTGVDVDSIEWDAWRRTDGTWSIVATFNAGPSSRSVTFSYDMQRKRITPADDESRSILGVAPVATPAKIVVASTDSKSPTSRQWDNAHPAARAQQRRTSTEAGHPSARPASVASMANTPVPNESPVDSAKREIVAPGAPQQAATRSAIPTPTPTPGSVRPATPTPASVRPATPTPASVRPATPTPANPTPVTLAPSQNEVIDKTPHWEGLLFGTPPLDDRNPQ